MYRKSAITFFAALSLTAQADPLASKVFVTNALNAVSTNLQAQISAHGTNAALHLTPEQSEKIENAITSVPPQSVTSVNGEIGEVWVTSDSIGALPSSAMPLGNPTKWRETSDLLVNFYFYEAVPSNGTIRSWFYYPPHRDTGESNVLIKTYFLPEQSDIDNWNAKADNTVTNGLATTNYVKEAIAAIPVSTNYVPLSEKELHYDSYTNLVWRDVWSNGWRFAVAYTNTP